MRYLRLSLKAILVLGFIPGIAFGQTVPDDSAEMADEISAESGAIDSDSSVLPQLPRLPRIRGVINPIEEPMPPRRVRRVVDPYSVNGYDSGAFQIKPSLDVSTVASSNVNRSPTAPQADVGVLIKPSVSFQSDWPVHEWKGAVSGELTKYAATGNSNLTGTAETEFRLDIRNHTFAEFSASASTEQSLAGQAEVPGTALAARRDTSLAASSAINHDFGPLQLRLKADAARNIYSDVALSDGTTEINSDRNYVEPALSLRASLGDEGARLIPFAEVKIDTRLHDTNLDRNGQQRNSQGASLGLGVSLDDGPIWMGEIAAVVTSRNYDDPSLPSALALGLDGRLTWSPSDPWAVTLATGVTLNESVQLGVSALPTWNLGLNATYAIRDNVELQAGNDWTLASNGVGINATTVLRAGGQWKLNPLLALSATAQSTWMMAAVAEESYNEQRITLGVVITP